MSPNKQLKPKQLKPQQEPLRVTSSYQADLENSHLPQVEEVAESLRLFSQLTYALFTQLRAESY